MEAPGGKEKHPDGLGEKGASSPSRKYFCCPVCHGDLKETDDGRAFTCEKCDCPYPAHEGYVDFTAPLVMDEFSRWQQSIYDGKEELQYKPYYADDVSLRSFTDLGMDLAKRHGMIMFGLKGMKSREIIDLVSPRQGERLLDVGCGTGALLNAMHLVYGTEGFGIDFSSAAIEAAVTYNPCGNSYEVADALKLPYKDDSFDLSLSFDAIEHVSDPEVFVQEMVRVTKPGGRIMLYTPSRRFRWTWHWWQIVMSRGKYGWDVLAGHDPERFLTPEELSSLMKQAGMKSVKTTAFHTLYTLIFDEVFPDIVFLLLEKPALCRAVYKALELADSPFSKRNYSNGFFAWGWNV